MNSKLSLWLTLAISVASSVVFFILAGLVVVLLHPVQYLFLRFGGISGQQKMITLSSRLVLAALKITGARYRFSSETTLPVKQPLVVISNHQSLFDIPLLQIYFSAFSPKFIAKHQLGKHFPSVSLALRHNGSVLIDRENQAQAIRQIFDLANRIIATQSAAVIFPEGSRHKDGKLHEFKTAGLKALLRKTENTLIIPVVIQGNANLFRRSKFLVCFGTRIHLHALAPIDPANRKSEDLMQEIHAKMSEALERI